MSDVKIKFDWGDASVDQPMPQAFKEKEDIYEGKRKQQLSKCLEAERKQREFHSRPVPNFPQIHERQAAKPVVHRVTQPVTPNVLKNSAPAEMRRRQRLELESSRPALKPLPSNFNAQTSQKQEARRQQQEQRLRKEREDYQKHRQLTTFRASPSPFSTTPR
ncbi:uncharacterized protein LOC117194864 [Drosophila miranda]|uniref:uncharacterized protein LOC117194864 n=1 Tax=Drosophila miranda TaxID=7229 RepID=UPI00143F7202|nr:uncharacterized protein LOC117194864 [Drosophila miranda]